MLLHSDLTISLGNEQLYIPKNSMRISTVWNVQRHCNAEWEFHFIQKGDCLVDVSQSQYRLCAGQGLLIPPGFYHQAKTLDTDLVHFTLGFVLDKGTTHQQLYSKMASMPVFTPSDRVFQTIDRLLAEAKSTAPYTAAYSEALVRCLVVELLRSMDIGSTPPQEQRIDPQLQLTQAIDTYFEQHFTDSCGEAELAKQLHFSRRHLVRILKKHYGMSFREKLHHARMDYAAFLLRTTDQPVGQIGMEVGYDSESAFFKVFRRTFGITPRQYRTGNK